MASLEVSHWLRRWSAIVPRRGNALDVAAGGGRHSHWLAGFGLRVTAIDKDPAAMGALGGQAGIFPEIADLEGSDWPLRGRSFDVVVVTNYLWRPHLPSLIANVAHGGVLLYETFRRGQERFGRPSNPAFLLEPGELLAAVIPQLTVIAFEDGVVREPHADADRGSARPRAVQRIAAVRPRPGVAPLLPID
ncbi:MAG: class I SAM-dependent methyltransferase [Planctomycetota bacterium]